jgi:uncharacterized membrane protein
MRAKSIGVAATSSGWDEDREEVGPHALSSQADDVATGLFRQTLRRREYRSPVVADHCDPSTGESTREEGNSMSDLIAIGYPDETTALKAEREAQRLAGELIIQPDAIAAIVRNEDGKFKVTTSHHHLVGGGASYGMFWGLLFGLLFFVPVFGMAIGAGLGALMGKLEKSGIDREFQEQVRDLLQPGTSALFLVVEKVTPDKAVEALGKYGGTVLKSSMSKEAEEELQEELHGSKLPGAV